MRHSTFISARLFLTAPPGKLTSSVWLVLIQGLRSGHRWTLPELSFGDVSLCYWNSLND